ncbi:uncharacterized protein LOC134202778 [Armigeres subalbatus]|uniref:uncharacterized protein LOC134202778 n=1 Tax=Armigeres subalbatus TaxID=124917 RepID=UPI002ED33639
MDCKKCLLPVTKDQPSIFCNAFALEPKCALHRDVEELKAKVETIMSLLAPNVKCSANSAMQHSTPKTSPKFSNTAPYVSTGRIESFVPPDASSRSFTSTNMEESFAMVLTNIDGSVSEKDVQEMVTRCLGACDKECVNVRKLVPRWVDSNTLDYISFKIVLDTKWKSAALTPTTWPKNVKFREFRQNLCTWKPDIC